MSRRARRQELADLGLDELFLVVVPNGTNVLLSIYRPRVALNMRLEAQWVMISC